MKYLFVCLFLAGCGGAPEPPPSPTDAGADAPAMCAYCSGPQWPVPAAAPECLGVWKLAPCTL